MRDSNIKKKRVVLVCGSSRGIGLKIAEIFLKNGDNVILSSRHISKNYKVIKNIYNKYSDKVAIYKCDFSKKESVKNLKEKVINKFKRIDILITSSGASHGNTMLPLKDFEMIESIKNNLMTCVFL